MSEQSPHPTAAPRRDGGSLAGSTAQQWDAVYAATPPWDTGRPQPAFVALADAGALTGRLLDVGCGTGENALLAAAHGADTSGLDISPRAIEAARGKATARGLSARFVVGDALRLHDLGEQFDVVLDSGTFHVFDDADRGRCVASLAAALRPGGRCHLLCFSERTPGTWGPRRISEDDLQTAFTDGWAIEAIEPAEFELPDGNPLASIAPAWFATIARTR
jgi:SAM-dependent methyltransferase